MIVDVHTAKSIVCLLLLGWAISERADERVAQVSVCVEMEAYGKQAAEVGRGGEGGGGER